MILPPAPDFMYVVLASPYGFEAWEWPPRLATLDGMEHFTHRNGTLNGRLRGRG